MTTYLLVIMRWICGCLVKRPATGAGVARFGFGICHRARFVAKRERDTTGLVSLSEWMNNVVTWLYYGARPLAFAMVPRDPSVGDGLSPDRDARTRWHEGAIATHPGIVRYHPDRLSFRSTVTSQNTLTLQNAAALYHAADRSR